MTDLGRLGKYGAVRRRYLTEPLPTSTTVEVSRLVHPEALVRPYPRSRERWSMPRTP